MPYTSRHRGFMNIGQSLIQMYSFVLALGYYWALINVTLRNCSTSNAWILIQNILIV